MSYIHIHELPEIRYNDVPDTAIIPIETEVDTWHILISDLKMLFSNDAKINSIYNSLMESIKRLETTFGESIESILETINDHDTQIKNLTEDVSKLNVRVTTLENNYETISGDLSGITERVSTIENNILSINQTLDNHNARITELENNVDIIKSDINDMKTTISNHGDSITQIQEDITEIYKQIDNMNAVSSDTIENLDNKLTELIQNKYEELLQLIDECHHQTPIIC